MTMQPQHSAFGEDGHQPSGDLKIAKENSLGLADIWKV